MKNGGKILRLLLSFAIFGVALFGLLNRQWIIDQATVWQFQPSEELVSLSKNARMSEAGRFTFYASQPRLSDREEFNTKCTHTESGTVVLGCYVGQRIFIYDITDKRLEGIREVTAAHELLHAAYERLSATDREYVVSLLHTESKKAMGPAFQKRLDAYKGVSEEDRNNELHSIFATEASSLSPELEGYYARYFTDRKAVVGLFKKYESVITDLQASQEALVKSLDSLADNINSGVKRYNQDSRQLANDISAFNARAAQRNGFAASTEFNAARSELIIRQQELSSRYAALQRQIQQYQAKKQQLDALQLQADSLRRSLDSTLAPVPSV
ncbi:MAG TPA: hypothetical protein VFZ48_04555 [Candidatus Saccharimonadales bacterium]